jgi:hypothetical protein
VRTDLVYAAQNRFRYFGMLRGKIVVSSNLMRPLFS